MQIDELRRALNGYKGRSCGTRTHVLGLKAPDLETCRPLSAESIEVVDTLEALQCCAGVLSSSSVLAVDVERHWLESYKGYVCLIQVSTAKAGGKAFLVDSLRFSHEQVKRCLGEVLEDPGILKVFHAAANDISWLREEFSIGLRCTLDTQALAHFLGCPIQKLTDQWSTFCNVHASADLKSRLQCSDWRRRPLVPVQVIYAAADSYCLLRIASFLLRVAALLFPSDFENTWVETSLCQPIQQFLMPGSEGRSWPEWQTPSQVAALCTASGASLWDGLAAAPDRPGNLPSRGATLRKALRNVAPPLHAAAVERLASWRDKVAEIADVSPQWVVPDKLLARAAAASTSAEARAALGEVLELDLVVDPDVEHALTGDALQVARQSHLTETSLAELLEHLSAARQVHHVPDECSETSCARWWLPFSSAAAFREAVSRLPERQQDRVMQEPLRKRARFLSFVQRVAAKGPVYENCRILAPDGQILCTVDKKKLNWYVRRGLARFEDGQTDCIRLLFEPRGRFGIRNELGSSENVPDEHMQQRERFYTSAKENRCVVCGSDVHLARYNLVPSCFRSFLPTSHQPGSHDVLLLCVPCHHKASTEHGQQIKESLAREVNVGVPKASPAKSDPRRRAAICASGLLKGGDNVPWPRAEVVFQRILRAWELGDDLSCLEPEVAADVGLSCYERAFQQKAPMLISRLEGRWPGATKVLWRASNWSEPGRHPGARCRNQQETEVGRRTVEAWMDSKRDLGDLVCRCRAHFVHIMRPEFLPAHWDITHRIAVRRL